MQQSPANSGLQQFLQTSRARLEFRSALSAGGITATVVCILAMPLIVWRADLGLHDAWLLGGIVVSAGAIYAILATRLHVALKQVPDKLEIVADDRERVASAAEFYGDDDPFKRLAIRQTEAWIDSEHERLSHMRVRKWPIVGAAAILALILLWLLTPGSRRQLLKSADTQLTMQSIGKSSSLPTPPSAIKEKKADAKQDVQSTASTNVKSVTGALERKPPSGSGVSPVQADAGMKGGNGNGGQGRKGAAGAGTEGSKSSSTGQLQKNQNSGSAPGPSPIGDNRNAPAINPTPTAKLSGGQTKKVEAVQARASKVVKEQQEIGKPDDVSPERAGPSNAQVNSTSIDTTELETLPPGRREIVIEYFRKMRGQPAPADKNSQGDSHP